MNELFYQAIPLLIPLGVFLLRQIVSFIPAKQIPAIVGTLGILIGAVTGQGHEDLVKMVTDALNGGLFALSGVGVHQVYKQAKKQT